MTSFSQKQVAWETAKMREHEEEIDRRDYIDMVSEAIWDDDNMLREALEEYPTEDEYKTVNRIVRRFAEALYAQGELP